MKHVGKKDPNSAGTWYLHIFRFRRYLGEKSDDVTRRWNFEFKLHYIMRGRPQDQHWPNQRPDEGDVAIFTAAFNRSFPVSRQWSTKTSEDLSIFAIIDIKVVRSSLAANKWKARDSEGPRFPVRYIMSDYGHGWSRAASQIGELKFAAGSKVRALQSVGSGCSCSGGL